MKKQLLFLLIIIQQIANAQIVSVNPNQAMRGESLITTITPAGAYMTTSSGMSSSYHFSLEQGGYVIPENNYTLVPTGLGFASAANVTFVIPYNALVGLYDVRIKNQFNPFDAILYNGFEVFETGFTGRVYFDGNQNGIFDAFDQGLNQQSIIVNPLHTLEMTDINGKYNSYMSGGTYYDSLIVPANFSLTTANSTHVVTVPPDTFGLDFPIYTPPSSIFIHNFISDVQQLRCFFPSLAGWSISSGSNNLQSGTITLIVDTNLSFISSGMPVTINGNTVAWNYTLHPFENIQEDFVLKGDTWSQFTSFALVDSLFDSLGTFVSATVDSFYRPISCSYDPNEKIVTPEGTDSLHHYTLKTDELKYTIRFQNCGNDTAFTVTIRDTISSSLDMSTFRVLYSSSPVSVQITNNNQVRFTFQNILLPDSGIDELHSHGMLIYSVSPNSNVPEFTIVKNKAYIYFDLNNSIITNQTMNTLVSQLNVGIESLNQNNNGLIYPNPSYGDINIFLQDKEYLVNIYSMKGELMISERASGHYKIKSHRLIEGMYYYNISCPGETKSITGKLIIIK